MLEAITEPVEIGEAIVTPEIIDRIASLQTDDDYMLKHYLSTLADAVCFFQTIQEDLPEKHTNEIKNHSMNIAYVRDFMKDFTKEN